MSRTCEVSGKKTVSGMSIARRGLPKKKGGVGLKTTGHTKRKFKANIQKVRVLLPNGTVTRMKLATSVIKSGKIRVTIDGQEQVVPLVKALRGRNRAFSKQAGEKADK
ncbi:MAG: 50S ribosomal protein L28 [Planctomycetota bacterium]|nr:MAG: 50S ribosomal protein L28 [Planctomycetota bacterium]